MGWCEEELESIPNQKQISSNETNRGSNGGSNIRTEDRMLRTEQRRNRTTQEPNNTSAHMRARQSGRAESETERAGLVHSRRPDLTWANMNGANTDSTHRTAHMGGSISPGIDGSKCTTSVPCVRGAPPAPAAGSGRSRKQPRSKTARERAPVLAAAGRSVTEPSPAEAAPAEPAPAPPPA